MPALPRARHALLLLAVAGWMLAAQPYRGVWHDGILYLGQALKASQVPGLAQDLFFASGSQDRYSVYARVVAPLYALLGPLTTHVLAVLLSWTLMAGAVWMLLRPLAPRWQVASWGLLAFMVVSPIYGGGWVFGYAEPFLTARTVAEPLLLWSLVALLRARLLAVAGLQGAALLFHPLMALPVILATGCQLALQDRRWWWLLSALPLAMLAGAAGIAPWDGLLKRYDPAWWSLIGAVNAKVLLQNWPLQDWLTLALDLAVLLAVARLRPQDGWTRLLHAVVITNVALFTVALLFAEGLQLVLLTQLQLWRAHWIAHLFAVIVSPWLAMRLWSQGGLWPACACALALALLNAHVRGAHGLASAGLLVFTALLAWRMRKVSSSIRWLVCGCILLCIAGISVAQLRDVLVMQGWQNPLAGWGASAMMLLSFPTVAMAGFAALWLLAYRTRIGWALAAAASVALFAFAAANWDQRPDLARAVESRPPTPHPFAAHLPPQATVYWPGQLLPVWGLLERRSHYAPQQGSGMLFNRGNAMAFGARREQYRDINEDQAQCRQSALLLRDREALTSCNAPTLPRLAALCRSSDPPDFVVLPEHHAQSPLATWQAPARRDPPHTFALHSCRQLAAL